jgi:hypothetical protein
VLGKYCRMSRSRYPTHGRRRKADPAATAFVNAFLQKIFDDGDWTKLYQQTITETARTPRPPVLHAGCAGGVVGASAVPDTSPF